MFSEQKATKHSVLARVIPRPEFVGTLHDSEMARTLGYPAALVPGIDLYAYLARLTLGTWGAKWLWNGTLASTSLRPVYDGEHLVVYATQVQDNGMVKTVDLAIHNASGFMVASGLASLATDGSPPPDLDLFPVLERPTVVPSGAPKALRPGMRFSSMAEEISANAAARQAEEFLETSPIYAQEGFIHPAYLQRLALRNAHASFSHATPPIYISTEGQHFSPARVGERIDVSGMINRLWERKGHHYMESEQLVIANGKRAVMLIRRTTIYQARQEPTITKQNAASADAAVEKPGH